MTAQRAKHVLFSRPYATQHATVLSHRTRGLAFQHRCPEEEGILALAHEERWEFGSDKQPLD